MNGGKQMKITYSQCEDYKIPDLSIPDCNYQIGKYGSLRRKFLKKYHRPIYSCMLMAGTLLEHLAEIDKTCNQYVEQLVSDMAKQEGVNEELKVSNQMEWVGRMNNIRNRAEEIALSEIIVYESVE